MRTIHGNQTDNYTVSNYRCLRNDDDMSQVSYMQDTNGVVTRRKKRQIEDFEKASKRVKPSAQREGFSTVPNTTW